MFLRRATASLLRSFSTQAKLLEVTVDDKSGVATVSMNRAPVNGLNLDLLTELSHTFSKLEENRCRGMILTSSLGTIFSGGLDITEMYQPSEERLRQFWTTLQEMWLKLYGSAYPTVAIVNGHSPAGGCMLATSCEYRIMLDNFTIGLNETKLGLVAPQWFIDAFKNTISNREAEFALTTGRLFTTQEALKVGLIDAIASSREDANAKAMEFFQKFAKVSPVGRQFTKQTLRGGALKALEKNRENELNLFVATITMDATQKALGKYMEGLRKKN